jgi:formamidopyrimidine-DNA glycosylase
MPELPEVETVRRQLSKEVVGRRIKAVEVNFGGRLNVEAGEFAAAMVGRTLKAVERRAKLLVLDFTGGWSLLVHLKMTGKFRLVPKGEPPGKHDHVVWRLAGPHDLMFNDFRKFGYLRLYPTGDVPQRVAAHGFGPEPLDRSFGAALFAECVRRKPKAKIKPMLMDQACLAGVGNIYADEALHAAGIAPGRAAGSLTDGETAKLHEALVTLLRASVRRRGTSADDFVDIYGRMGTNQGHLSVYGRGGEPCVTCGGPIRKIRLAGRGTHYCPRCQK